ncbi:MAG: nucleotidyltransferase domain-containing protein [Cyanobacteriota bacterium]|nr:nucleotidyltransferase domain-containing protein [Cyanobacteriota bacterium]
MTQPFSIAQTQLVLRPDLSISQKKLKALCDCWQIVELACFGSVLRDDFRPDSDIDLLVTWNPSVRWTLLDLAQMQFDFEALLERSVDLVSRRAIEQSDNPLRRAAILNTATPIYRQT